MIYSRKLIILFVLVLLIQYSNDSAAKTNYFFNLSVS